MTKQILDTTAVFELAEYLVHKADNIELPPIALAASDETKLAAFRVASEMVSQRLAARIMSMTIQAALANLLKK